MEQQAQEAEAQEEFEVDDEDIELDGVDAEEWTGFSEPAHEDSANEEPADETLSSEVEEPVASTSKPTKVTSGPLPNAEYETAFDGE